MVNNGLDNRFQQEKNYQNEELIFLGFEKSFKNAGQVYQIILHRFKS